MFIVRRGLSRPNNDHQRCLVAAKTANPSAGRKPTQGDRPAHKCPEGRRGRNAKLVAA